MSDIELKHSDSGNGEPAIVFVHGFCSGPEDWMPQVEHLQGRQRVITVGLRGHGISQRGTRDMSMEQLASDCLELMAEKNIARAVFAGHSMGTRIAIEAHRRAPDLVAGLVLVDGSNSTAVTDVDTAMAGFESTLAIGGYGAFADTLFAQMFFDEKHDALKQKYIARALAVPEEIGVPLYRNLIKWDGNVARDALRQATVPILVIQSTTRDAAGGRRPLEPGETGAYEAFVEEFAPRADIVAMPGLGHYTMLEAPAETNAAIDSWLDGNGLRP